MKIVLKKNNATLLHAVFAIWLLGEFLFPHTAISRLVLAFYVGITIMITHKLCWSRFLTGYLLFTIWSVLNIVTNHAVSKYTATEMTKTLLLLLAFLYSFICYCKYVGDIMAVLRVFKTVMLVFSVFCLVGGAGRVMTGQRLSILDLNANTIGVLVGYAFLVQMYLLINKGIKAAGWRDYLSLVIFAATIMLAASRKGLIILIVGIYVLVCFQKPQKFVWYSLLALVLGTVLINVFMRVEFLYDVVGVRIEPLLNYLQGESFEEASLSSRVNYIELGWNASQNSLIWGHGLDCFRHLRGSGNTYSHNNYIEILYSLGWVGVIFYYLPHVYTLIQLPKVIAEKRQHTSLAVAFFVAFAICDYGNVTYFRRILLIIPVIAMLIMEKRGKE